MSDYAMAACRWARWRGKNSTVRIGPVVGAATGVKVMKPQMWHGTARKEGTDTEERG